MSKLPDCYESERTNSLPLVLYESQNFLDATNLTETYNSPPVFLNKGKLESESEESCKISNEDYINPDEELKEENAIKATNIPTDTTAKDIWLFFEKFKNGGEVVNVEFDKSTYSAVISFKKDYGIVL